MKDFLREDNLRRAGLLGLAATAMAVPRLFEADLPMRFPWLLLFTFATMTAAGGAAAAWQCRAGMAGLFPGRRRILAGMAWAAGIGIVMAAILQATDPLLREAILARDDERLWQTTFPATPREAVSRILWGAGAQTLFFTAAALGFFTRLTGRLWLAILFIVVLRVLVTVHKFADAGLTDVILPYATLAAANGLASCLLYARAGLPAAMTFSATVDLRHFLNLEIARSFPDP